MIVKFWDKSQIIVSTKQWESISRMRASGKSWIVLKNPAIEFDPKTISQVLPGGVSEVEVIAPGRRINAGEPKKRASRSTVSSIREELAKRGIVKRKGTK